MVRWLALLVMVGCGGGLTIDEYPSAFRDAYCKYLTRCGAFPDIGTCENANIGLSLYLDPSTKAAVDSGKVVFDGSLAQDCLDEFGAQTCDTTDADSRSFFPAKCEDIVKGTIGSGGACALDAECKSKSCNVPTCTNACCQGTCMGDAPPVLGETGAACQSTAACAVGYFCDFTTQMCADLKPAGAMCSTSNECAFGLGCGGGMCKMLPTLGQACPDGLCRDAGLYCNSVAMCAKIGLSGAACTSVPGECSSFYPCDQGTMKCTKAPGLGESCTSGCFDAGTFCDAQNTRTCVKTLPDGGTCVSNGQCAHDNCDTGSGGGSGTCTTPDACI